MHTCRRILIDHFLEQHRELMRGHVLDIGGKNERRRGDFVPPQQGVVSWRSVNIDEGTKPDFLCDASAIPLEDGAVDVFLLCEVLEHLAHPEAVLLEAGRVLTAGGVGLITMPFMYPVHADPWDFQRWTAEKLSSEVHAAGLRVRVLTPMGGPVAVVCDTIQVWLQGRIRHGSFMARLALKCLGVGRWLIGRKRCLVGHPNITTGFGLVVEKE
jgi:SAM-dependent methyltransferase